MIKKEEISQSLPELANAAFQVTAKRVIDRARLTGTQLILWKDGRVVRVSPEQFTNAARDRQQHES